MNIKQDKIFQVCAIILVHLLLICLGGYFLSPEFTVYPYLTSLGLKPYLNIIDQHLPIIFFGPLSLSKTLTQNPQPLLGLFLSLVATTDLLFFYLVKKQKVKKPVFWTALFAVTIFIFQGSTLWLETFITPLVLLILFLKQDFFTGLLSALIILIRPTLAPAILLLVAAKKPKPSRSLLAGFLTPLLAVFTYLIYQQIIPDFTNLFFNFNSTYYSALAGKLPSLRQLFLAGLVVVPAMATLFVNKKYLRVLIIILSFLPAWPRFELTHLQPAITLAIFFWATDTSRHSGKWSLRNASRIRFWTSQNDYKKLLLIFLLILSIKKVTTVNYGNFYLTPEVQKVSAYLKDQTEQQVFVLGGSDLIYPLAHKNPAGDYYLPSLAWYYANPDLVTRQLEALKLSKHALVAINTPVENFAKPVYQHILEQYTKIHTVGPYQIYKAKP